MIICQLRQRGTIDVVIWHGIFFEGVVPPPRSFPFPENPSGRCPAYSLFTSPRVYTSTVQMWLFDSCQRTDDTRTINCSGSAATSGGTEKGASSEPPNAQHAARIRRVALLTPASVYCHFTNSGNDSPGTGTSHRPANQIHNQPSPGSPETRGPSLLKRGPPAPSSITFAPEWQDAATSPTEVEGAELGVIPINTRGNITSSRSYGLHQLMGMDRRRRCRMGGEGLHNHSIPPPHIPGHHTSCVHRSDRVCIRHNEQNT